MMMMILEIVMELALKQVELRGALICYGAIENHHNMQKLFNLGYFQSFRFTTDIKGIRIMLILFHPPPPNTTRMFLQEDGLDQYKAELMLVYSQQIFPLDYILQSLLAIRNNGRIC